MVLLQAIPTEVFLMKFSYVNLFVIIFFTSINSYSNYALATNDDGLSKVKRFQSQFKAVDNAHQKYTKSFYQQLIKAPALQTAHFNDIESLNRAIQGEIEQQNTIKAVALTLRNKNLLKRFYDDPVVVGLLKLLLDTNNFTSADSLINEMKSYGDDNLNEQLNYLLADFYFQRKDWQTVLKLISADTTDLPSSQYYHALLMRGVALQEQGEHAQSMLAYKKIPNNSEHYTAAQLNIAIANIRQGWWTDGHEVIEKLLTTEPVVMEEQVINRLYITLGYSLLNQAYYRNARKAFQLISIDSRYSNQALLGIALAAAYQDDYIGALNASRLLKAKQQDDLPIDEAFLLMPFFYEKSQQLATASLGYSQASQYYQDKISKLHRHINQPFNVSTSAVEVNKDLSITIDDSYIDFQKDYPKYFFSQREIAKSLQAWQKKANTLNSSQHLAKAAIALNQQYDDLLEKIAKSLLQNRVAQLNSYLNQSRYGLARLYDNNTAAQ